MNMLRQWGEAALAMVFPRLCEVCGRALTLQERDMCIHCRMDMPRVHVSSWDFNEIHERVQGHALTGRAAAMMYYNHSSGYANLIRRGKYNDRPGLLRRMSSEFAAELAAGGFFQGVEEVIPVAMARMKQWRRGYNQSQIIAEEMAAVAGVPVGLCLRARRHATQTRRGRSGRAANVSGVYTAECTPSRQVLLVDDIITSGATVRACCEALEAANPGIRIHIAALGLTRS